MGKKELKERMRHGLLDLAPDIYDQIQHAPLPDFLILESESSGQSPASLSQQRYRRVYRFAAVAAACLLLLLLPGIFRESSVYVLLEINPSICLELNTDYQLRTAKGLNSDGVQLLEELSFDKYEPLEQVMEHLFTQLQADDYLHNDGGILVSVSRTEEPFYQELKDRLQDEINRNLLRSGISSFSVAFQFTEHAESTGRKALERELAEKHGLSPAEAASLNIRELINCAQEYGVPELEISETEATETEVSEPEITETEAAETETTGTETPEMGAAVSPAKEAPDTLPSSGKTSPSSRQTEETAEVLPETAEETEPESEAETPTVSAPEPSVSAAQTQTSGSDKNSRQEETSETHSSPPSPPKKKPGKTSKKTKKEKKNSSAKRKKKSSSSSKKNKSSSSKRKKKSSSSNKKKENSSARKKNKSSSSNKKKENSSAKKKKSNHSSQKKKESSTPRKKSAKAASGKAEDSKSARKQEETSKPATSKDASSLNSNAPSSKKKQANTPEASGVL